MSTNPIRIKSYPVFETRMFQPIDQPISTTQAKRLFGQLLRDSGCYDRLDIQMLVEYFSIDLRERVRSLRDELAILKSEIRDTLAGNKEDAENLADAITDAQSEDELAAIDEQIALSKLRSVSAKRRIAETADDLNALRRD